MRSRNAVGAGLVVTLLAWGWSADLVHPTRAIPEEPYGVSPPAGKPLSSTSCSASACHGNGQPGRAGGEYTTWAPDLSDDRPPDPHAHAYRVLFSEAAVRMAGAVGVAAPHREAACLKCHSVDRVTPASAASEGVGCGACHGAADKWLTEHYTATWATLSPRDRWERFGFVPTKNLTARTLTCVGCHVGDADREVNHDLIAAGHPRLAFEAARFHTLPTYRKHWKERTPQPEFEVRLWVIGQAAGLRASAELLRVRAERAAKGGKTPWPEFSGFSCYSCHRPIGSESGTSERPVSAGTPGWERWSTAAVTVAATHTPELFPGSPAPALKAVHELERLMAERAPKPETVQKAAAEAVVELDGWLGALQASEDRGGDRPKPEAAKDLIRALAANALDADRRSIRDTDWDFLAAHTLGCSAGVHATAGPGATPSGGTPVQRLHELLRFPPPTDGTVRHSPKGIGTEDRERLTESFRTLSETDSRKGGK